MSICEYSHPEVCFEGRQCPICEVLADKEKQIEGLQDSLREAESTIAELKKDIESQ